MPRAPREYIKKIHLKVIDSKSQLTFLLAVEGESGALPPSLHHNVKLGRHLMLGIKLPNDSKQCGELMEKLWLYNRDFITAQQSRILSEGVCWMELGDNIAQPYNSREKPDDPSFLEEILDGLKDVGIETAPYTRQCLKNIALRIATKSKAMEGKWAL